MAKDNGGKCGFITKAYCEKDEYCSPMQECGPKLTHRARGTPFHIYSGKFWKIVCEHFDGKKAEEEAKKK